jgi:hypothetical protein
MPMAAKGTRDKPISSSNPPESRGLRLPKDGEPLTSVPDVTAPKEGVKPTEQTVYQPTSQTKTPATPPKSGKTTTIKGGTKTE